MTFNEAVEKQIQLRIQALSNYISKLPWWKFVRRRRAQQALENYERYLREFRKERELDRLMGVEDKEYNPENDKIAVYLLAQPDLSD